MLNIVRAIYKMTGQMVKLPEDEDTPEKVRRLTVCSMSCLHERDEQRVDKIFKNMDIDSNHSLDYAEFVEGSKKDPTIIQALSLCVCLHSQLVRLLIVRFACRYDGLV